MVQGAQSHFEVVWPGGLEFCELFGRRVCESQPGSVEHLSRRVVTASLTQLIVLVPSVNRITDEGMS